MLGIQVGCYGAWLWSYAVGFLYNFISLFYRSDGFDVLLSLFPCIIVVVAIDTTILSINNT